ncbi:hypothetical protein, partial [Rosenbergiella collisarenosi]|uniref:hypothetical protein n=1 Tax=Rosenbergiella collisarenosi TaxID=1544695 RepID=UPI00240CEDF7
YWCDRPASWRYPAPLWRALHTSRTPWHAPRQPDWRSGHMPAADRLRSPGYSPFRQRTPPPSALSL